MQLDTSLLYRILAPIVKMGFHHFFSKIEVHGQENWPINKPLILVANHQNAMLDPVVICVHAPVPLHWLTRADVFKNPRIDKILRKVNMLPVYRERDKVEDLHSVNQITFDEVNKRLLAGSTICIFPEGTHRGKKQLHSLKKGVARMAQTAYRSGIHDLCILPVGLDYEDYYNYRKRLLINIGKPIPVSSFFAELGDDVRQQQRVLLAIKAELGKVMVDIREDHWYNDMMALRPFSDAASRSNVLSQQFNHYHNNLIRLGQDKTLLEEVMIILHQISPLGNQIGLKESRFQPNPTIAIVWWMVLLIPSLIAMVCWFPLYSITESIQRKIVKDPLFRNSIRLVFWTFGGILWWFVLLALAFILTPNWICAIGSGVLAYLCGRLGMAWLGYNRTIRNYFRTRLVANAQPEAFNKWSELRNKLIEKLS